MITTRNDLITAKAQLDNLDQINAALTFLGKTSGSITVAPTPGISIIFDVADLATYLTSVRDKTVLNLSNSYGVTSL
jgi:hypothetical protein